MNDASLDYIAPQQAVTLDGLLRERVRRNPDALAYRAFDRQAGEWVDWSWRDVAREVGRWQQALRAEGLQPGDRLALQLRNSPEWVVVEQAALGLGLVVVPLYLDDRPDSVAYILRDCGARILVLADDRYRRLASALGGVEVLQRIVVLPAEGDNDKDPRVRGAASWLGDSAPLASAPADTDDLATIVYTSGTLGRSKGVMLSHGNILANAYAAANLFAFSRDDLFLSILPLSHMLERTGGYYLPMVAGSAVAYARSVQQLAQDLQEQRPTMIIAVPRLFERIYARIEERLQHAPLQRLLFRFAVAVGWRRFEAAQGRGSAGLLRWLWPLLRRRVAAKAVQRFGGRLRLAISGGAALPAPVARMFIGLGIDVLQGYGLTEAAPVVSVNLPNDNAPGSVGLPLPNVEVRVGDHSELLVRGPNVMLGYWNDHNATYAALSADGWLRTGDQARLEQGHVFLTGRLKEIIVLSNGEKVAPSELEAAIGLDALFEQALVIGEGEAYLAALVALNAEHWCEWVKTLHLDPFAPASLQDAHVHRLVLKRIAAALHDYPAYAKVRRVALTLDEWSVDNGMLTPTLKLRRNQVQQHYQEPIAALFDEC